MSEASLEASKPAAAVRSRQWLVAALFMCWAALAAITVWWLIGDAARSGNTVIRVNPGEAKAWSVRLRETVALARLNFPWALAWIFLAPYVLWIGVRFSFEAACWRTRLPVLLATGVGFIWASQWLSQRFGAGQAVIVMVNYRSDTSVRKIDPPAGEIDESFSLFSRGAGTNRFVTNRITKVMISGEAADRTNWEMTATEMLSGMPTNFPPFFVGAGAGHLPPPKPLRTGRWAGALDGLAYVALIGLAHAGVFYRRYREREQQAARLESRLNQAQLRALQTQLQPHFLFNTLNGIATLLRRDPAKAEEMLLSLSDLLRISLSSSRRHEIPLREEMDFLGRYLALQRMRFGDRLRVTEEIEPAAMDCLVPALLLQPLVENAIRHGLEPAGRPGELRLAAVRNGEWLRLTVADDGVGLPPGDQNRAGVGLANVRERLAALYGAAHEFSIAERPGGGVVASLKLPARTEVESPPCNGNSPGQGPQCASPDSQSRPLPSRSPAPSGGAGGRRPGAGEVHEKDNLA
jgi:anti-sigma regulatory factor (Ser/Thr protein kinase)